jgi:hypothetical protein
MRCLLNGRVSKLNRNCLRHTSLEASRTQTMPHRRLNLTVLRTPAVTVTKDAMREDAIVYVLSADKQITYPTKRSRIVYIGMTEAGVHRVAKSAADRAEDILGMRGVRSFQARVVHYPASAIDLRQRWLKNPPNLLERALLIAFRDEYGDIPRCNGSGHRMKPDFEEFQRFSRARLAVILGELS